jgi:hypothetical protein
MSTSPTRVHALYAAILMSLLQLSFPVCCSSRGASTPHRLLVNDIESLTESGFDPKNPTKILIHGFGGNGQSANIINSRDGEYGVSLHCPYTRTKTTFCIEQICCKLISERRMYVCNLSSLACWATYSAFKQKFNDSSLDRQACVQYTKY